MSKKTICLSVEESLYIDYKHIIGKGNISQDIEKYMQSVVGVGKKEITGIDMDLLRKELEIEGKEHSKRVIEMEKKRKILEIAEKKIEEEQVKILTEEKKKIAAQSICQNCKNVISSPRRHTFAIGTICNACFLTSNNDDIKRWSIISEAK